MRTITRALLAIGLLTAIGFAEPKHKERLRPWQAVAPVPREEVKPMATPNVWQSTDGDWTNTASWGAGAVPVNGHIAIFDGTSQVTPTINIALGNNGPDELSIQPGYYGGIGGPGNYLTNLATNTAKVVIRGHGNYYLTPTKSGAIVVIDIGPDAYVELNGATLPSAYVKSGRLWVTRNSAFRDTTILATYGETAHVTVQPSTGATFPLGIVCHQGYILYQNETDSGSTSNLVVRGGHVRQEGIIEGPTFVYVTGGTLEYVPSSDPGGNFPWFEVNSVFDVRESQFAIPAGGLVLGPDAEVLDSAIENLESVVTIDLRKENP